ncbi:MltA domain-containing protein [Pseudodesulfovibrio indicus]|uniref:peptidoglycan lytic exotransglycosylase n=1 Tax=Pseudodesulfovibrio indicus TaxID=1716143 RepID=A0A126QQC5_9BACT|nr:MltA domain-containing protein [Pseudodesulfovibrio indicus]AMK12142.1 transglycosylase [Pseudodesulfovibrio indicus]TDT88746.1 membrane-bound lytic murein transglycosylase A [Pseudodesulfovibrio indicus]
MRKPYPEIKTTAGRALRLLLAVCCLAALMSCVKYGPIYRGQVEDPAPSAGEAVAEGETGEAAPCAVGEEPESGLTGLYRARVVDRLSLKPVREPLSIPTCDMFFPLSNVEGAENLARLDIRSQGLTSWTALEDPVQRSLEYALNMPKDEPALARPGMSLTWGQVVRSLEEFLDLLPLLDSDPDLLAERFVWYGMRQKPLMTGYYTPEIEASLERIPGYDFPIYGVPDDLRYGPVRGHAQFYRVEKGSVLPYYRRGDVDIDKVLSGRGLEIAWAKDPVDVFYMQVEGCGRLRLPDGTTRNVLYGAKNGYGFRSLGRILHSKGLLADGHLAKEHVKEYFASHPEQMFELMAENRSYVFFRLENSPPEGTIGKPLTPMVSLATDRKLLPLGSLLAFEAEIPEAAGGRPSGKRKVAGIGLAQDTGTAIQGSRVDYYIGEGNEVAPIASNIKTEATVYLLISKEALING